MMLLELFGGGSVGGGSAIAKIDYFTYSTTG